MAGRLYGPPRDPKLPVGRIPPAISLADRYCLISQGNRPA
jgi:hypothetical protein